MTSVMTKGRTTQQPGRASDRVLTDLRRMILTLELSPGAVVTEASLVELLGCSRTPLREALQRLSHEHLVVAVPRRGVTVADLSIVDFSALIQAEEGVESTVSRLAAERITDDQLDHLGELLARSDEAAAARDMAELVDLDFQIHTTFGVASGNRFLLEFQEIAPASPRAVHLPRFPACGERRRGDRRSSPHRGCASQPRPDRLRSRPALAHLARTRTHEKRAVEGPYGGPPWRAGTPKMLTVLDGPPSSTWGGVSIEDGLGPVGAEGPSQRVDTQGGTA